MKVSRGGGGGGGRAKARYFESVSDGVIKSSLGFSWSAYCPKRSLFVDTALAILGRTVRKSDETGAPFHVKKIAERRGMATATATAAKGERMYRQRDRAVARLVGPSSQGGGDRYRMRRVRRCSAPLALAPLGVILF